MNELADYIQRQMKAGYSAESVRGLLLKHGHNPSAIDQAMHGAATGMKYAGFWIRVVAMLLDGLILGVPASIIQFFLVLWTESSSPFYIVQIGLIVLILYFWVEKGATPGKMILGLRIVDENNQNVTWGRAILRYIGYFISGIILFIGYIMIAFTKKKQGLHDIIAKTYVIKK